jgi:anthranilate 1,2-dioxygenase small subunit
MTSPRELVETLLYRYAAVIDDGDLADWPGFFGEDAEYRLISRENYARGLPVCVMYCKNRAMMRDRVVAIKRASVYTPQFYRHHYSNVMVERIGAELSVRANYLVCRTREDGDTIVFSTGRLIAQVMAPDDVMPLSVPGGALAGARGELTGSRGEGMGTRTEGSAETAPWTIQSVDLSVTGPPGGTARGSWAPAAATPGAAVLAGVTGVEQGVGAASGRGLPSERPPAAAVPTTLRPPSFDTGSRAPATPSVRPGSVSLLPPPSSRRQPGGPVFVSMTVVYDTCRIPGLLVFPL